MNTAEKLTIVEEILTRAAEQVGDITPAAMDLYYRNHPEAKDSFEKHSHGGRTQLEGQMIENSVHCLMRWIESPAEIEILLGESVPHHADTLHVPPDLYRALIEATADVIAVTIPEENADELAVWNEVRGDLHRVIDDCGKTLTRRQVGH